MIISDSNASTVTYDKDTNIVTKKQALRDAPADSGITSAKDTDELKAQWKTDILGTSPYS